MLTLSNFTRILLFTTASLLLTGCGGDNSKTDTQTNTIPATPGSQTASAQTAVVQVDAKGIKSLALTISKTVLNKDENTTVEVMVIYDDGTNKDMTDKVEWVATPKDAVKVTGKTLIAKRDNTTILQAKLGDLFSNDVALDITWVVNGHTLPPEPDKVLNDSTLLGIDVNNNGVRDDVERWIYETYNNKHPIHIDIAMQAVRAYKQVLETPEKAKEIHNLVNAPFFCAWYYQNDAKYFNEPLLVQERIDTKVKSKFFNTKERSDIYWQYDTLLSGDSYALPKTSKRKALCDFNTSKYE